MPRPFKHTHAVNAPSVRESAWSDIFGRSAPTIQTYTSNSASTPSDSPSLAAGISSLTPTILEPTSQYSSTVTSTTTATSDGDTLLNCP
ncbi:unnamed protein product [Schistocephalus solidus]|uniref:Uncharacterized protein n=1 Tax=Schistocephalus solidus TaxID=70667 RepID=A0A183TGP8_SCHSO|nr:unnamed protein product [Schistocephalus solidus]